MLDYKKMKKNVFFTFLALVMMTAQAQTENPRGIYKLTSLIDKEGLTIQAPFDQYKICMDSVTLMFTVQGGGYSLDKNDLQMFNYTGEMHDANNATATRIFDSNAEHFTLKWWSTYNNHLYFPHNDWCTEFYESGKYSVHAKAILDALMLLALIATSTFAQPRKIMHTVHELLAHYRTLLLPDVPIDDWDLDATARKRNNK